MSVFDSVRSRLRPWAPRLRYCLRVTVAGVAAFAIARGLGFPLHGLWAVLTAIVVSQVSVGGSVRATIEYNIGTLGGAVYAAAVGLLIPHQTPVMQAVALAVSVAPMAVAAAMNPAFRVAPFSAVLVLLIGAELGESPIQSALTRVAEVLIGGVVAIVVSLIVLPQRAHTLGLNAAARIMNQAAELLPMLLAPASRQGRKVEIAMAQSGLGASVTAFQGLAEEAKRERFVSFVRDPDATPLARTLLRIRHDLVILSRATVEPFPETIEARLDPALTGFSHEATTFLRKSAEELVSRAPAPPIAPTEAALAAYNAVIAPIREEGPALAMSTIEIERLFALGFALEQLVRDLTDLAHRIEDNARAGAAQTPH